jgi:PKD repeat protein
MFSLPAAIAHPSRLPLLAALVMLVSLFPAQAHALAVGDITTVAGDGSSGYGGDGAPATSAALSPWFLQSDSAGNLYLGDFDNCCIRKVNSAGIISTIAGVPLFGGNTGNGGSATAAEMKYPSGMVFDATGNLDFIDRGNGALRQVTTTGQMEVLLSSLNLPAGMVEDSTGNLYIADEYNQRVLKMTSSGTVSTVAGTLGVIGYTGDGGSATAATMNHPFNLALDGSGDLFICDALNSVVRKVVLATGIITTVAGNGTAGYSGDGGPALSAQLDNPTGLTFNSHGDLYITDDANHVVRELLSTGTIITIAGTGTAGYNGDGIPATSAELNNPISTLLLGNTLYIADRINYRVRALALPTAPTVTSATAAAAAVGVPFAYTVTGSNSPVIYHATGLPAGLTLNATSGAISGVAMAAGTFPVTISASNAGGTGSTTLTLAVEAESSSLTWTAPAGITYGTALSATQLSATAAPTIYADLIAGGIGSGFNTCLLNGGTWQSFAFGSSGLAEARWTGSQWVGVDNSGNAATSPDGVVWTTVANLATGTPLHIGGSGATIAVELNPAVVRISIDGGNTWDPNQYTPFAGQSSVHMSHPTVVGSTVLVLAQVGLNVEVASADLTALPAPGTPWNLTTLALGTPGDFFVQGATITACAGNAVPGVPQLYQSTGAGWSDLATNLPSGSNFAYSLIASTALNDYLVGTTASPYLLDSTDLVHWTAMGTGLTTTVDAIAEYGGTVYASQRNSGVLSWNGAAWVTAATASGLSCYSLDALPAGTVPTLPGTYTYSPPLGTVLGAGNNILSVTFTPTNTAYAPASATTAITVAQALPTLTWTTPAPITTAIALGSTQLDANASVPGTIAYTPAAGATLAPGIQVLTATFTPTDAADYTSVSATTTVTVVQATPVITSAGAASAQVGQPFTYQIPAANDPQSFNASGLPAGLTVDISTGAITGTPTAPGTSNVTISATNVGGTGISTLAITVLPAAPVITSATAANAQTGTTFTYQITATNTPTGFTASGLPAGLSVDATTGAITGTPTASGASTVTISATNPGGTGSATLALTVDPAAPVITSATAANAESGAPFTYQITATNTPTGFTASGLPAGLSVDATTGAITGTPTAAGASTVTITATNSGGTGSATLAITVDPALPVVTSPTTLTGQVGVVITYQITASNNPTAYGATNLPAGLTFSNGVVSGTPTTAGTVVMTVTATNISGTATATITVTIAPAAAGNATGNVTTSSGSGGGCGMSSGLAALLLALVAALRRTARKPAAR